jgi:hypothetical protein
LWRRVNAPPGVVFTTVIPDVTGFLAVSPSSSSEATDYAPTFWRSADGLTWNQTGSPSIAAFAPDQPDRYFYAVTGLARVGRLIVAVGARMLLDASTADAAMWYSADDGTTWHRTASGSTFPDSYVYAVAHGRNGFVAVGSNGYPGASTQDTGTRGAAVWTSADGRRWTRVPTHTAFRGAFMRSVTATPMGYVAGGEAHSAGPPGAGTVAPLWTSTDGRTWHRVRGSASLRNSDGLVVAATSDGLVATGTLFDPVAGSWRGAAWTSATGSSWRRATTDGGFIIRTVSVGGQLIAVGSAANSAAAISTYVLGVWTSSSGRSWQAIPAAAGSSDGIVRDAAAQGGRIVIVGESTDPNLVAPQGFVWVGVRT